MVDNILTRTKPQFPWAIFGEGLSAEVWDSIPVRLENGLEGWEFLMRPSQQTIQYYNLKHGVNMTKEGFVKAKYPNSQVWKLRDDPVYGRWLIYSTFKGQPTSFSKREQYYTSQIDALQKIIHLLRSENAVLYVRLQNMAAKHNIYYKDVVGLFREINKVRGSYVKKEDEEKDDE